jgi:hypothetical protein
VVGAEGWQGFDRLARLLLRQANFIQALQVQPELRRGAEEMSQPQGGVAGNGAASVEDLGNAVGRNVEPARQLGGAQIQLEQFFGEVQAGLDGSTRHDVILNEHRSERDKQQVLRLRARPIRKRRGSVKAGGRSAQDDKSKETSEGAIANS